MFDIIFNISFIMFFVIGGISLAIFIFVLVSIFNPKMRGKMISNQVKAMRHGVDFAKEDLEHMNTTLGNLSIDTKKNIYDENEDILKDLASRSANINKDAIKTVTSAIREGLTSDNKIYCKYCGEAIDEDSKFCKKCGKEL